MTSSISLLITIAPQQDLTVKDKNTELLTYNK